MKLNSFRTVSQESRETESPPRPLPFCDPFISLTSFDARTKPGPTDRPSLDLGFFLAAVSIYNLVRGVEMGQDVKVELGRRTLHSSLTVCVRR